MTNQPAPKKPTPKAPPKIVTPAEQVRENASAVNSEWEVNPRIIVKPEQILAPNIKDTEIARQFSDACRMHPIDRINNYYKVGSIRGGAKKIQFRIQDFHKTDSGCHLQPEQPHAARYNVCKCRQCFVTTLIAIVMMDMMIFAPCPKVVYADSELGKGEVG